MTTTDTQAVGERAAGSVLEPGRSCWKVERADRLAWLIDGEAAFRAIWEALREAERQVVLVGWDFHSRVALVRGDEDGDESPRELLDLLEWRVRARPELEVHVLGWDYNAIYSLEREFLPRFRFGRRTHRRIHFRLDGDHPLMASHHQKIAVIDDRVAFTGGLDLTTCRWDTRDHAPDDPRRTTPDGTRYGPFHDVQVAVSGPAAVALGELARERWRRATGHTLEAPSVRGECWPASARTVGERVEVGVARTEPEHRGRERVCEIEELYVAAIRSARRSIYIENQYLTSERISEVLRERLEEDDGPDVVIVGPHHAAGWLETRSMGVLRDRLIASLREADGGGRLRIFYPYVPELGEEIVNVHAKVLVVDDRIARVGSSNLSNRSMGLDTECDLAVDASGDAAWIPVVTALRDELLAEHLGSTAERVAGAIAAKGSLVAAIDSLRSEGRSLRPLEGPDDQDVAAWLAAGVSWADPDAPLDVEQLASALTGDGERVGSWLGPAYLALWLPPILAAAAWLVFG